jgi:hypothetical protein
MSPRSASIAVGLGLTLTLAACASHRYVPAKAPGLPTSEGSTIAFDIVPDGEGGCGKGPVPSGYGTSETTVTWRITNKCVVNGEKKTVRVRIEDFHIKHKVFKGPNPFKSAPEHVTITADETRNVAAVVLHTNAVSADYKGFNVYRYKVKVKVEGGRDNNKDPEIIIEWP